MADVTEYKRSDARMAKDWLGMAKRDAAEKNTPQTKQELRRMQEFADLTEKSYQQQLARDAHVGAGRGEVNPSKGNGYAKGGSVKGWGKARSARAAKYY